MLFYFIWGISVYTSDFSESRIVEMKAQERCLLFEYKQSKIIKDSCIKERYSAVIKTTNKDVTNTHKFGKDVVSDLAFCEASEGDITCLKKNTLVGGTGIDIGLVYTG